MTPFHKIVFSKQADHDADFQPVWLRWYTEVFKADTIIITPVKTPASSISSTVARYTNAGFIVRSIDLPLGWDDRVIWRIQLDTVKEFLPQAPFLVVSADTDQLFYPPDLLTDDGWPYLFRRITVLTNGREVLNCVAELGYTCGFVNTLNDCRVRPTGHWGGGRVSRPYSTELHIWFRGFNYLLQKLTSLQFSPSSYRGGASHWRKLIRLLRRRGPSGLKEQYNQWTSSYTQHSNSIPQKHQDAISCLRNILASTELK